MRLLATVTFNANQLRSHLLPILRIPEVEEVVLVTDREPPPLPKLRAVVPTNAERRLLGRAGSKLRRCAILARRLKPEWIVSYNVMPHGVNGFVAGRASGSRTLYHMIGGEAEWAGGGWRSDNAILGRLPRPVPPLERALLGVIRRADVVGTMGTHARSILLDNGLDPARVVVTPPSVDTERFEPTPAERRYDLVSVGDLIDRKRFGDFVDIVAKLRTRRPDIRAALVGAGPLEAELRSRARDARVDDAIDFVGRRLDVERVYAEARVFVLTSLHEGLSVAMLEAMASGLPAVVSDVGDLSDVVRTGRNGALVAVGNIDGFVAAIERLLGDPNQYAEAAAAARADAVAHASVEHVSDVYRRILVDGEAA